MFVEINIMGTGVVSSIEIVGMSWEFSGEGVNALDEGCDVHSLASSTDGILLGRDEVGDVRVRETLALRALHELSVDVLERGSLLEREDRVDDVLDLVQEPLYTIR